jgi:hypothetical protein
LKAIYYDPSKAEVFLDRINSIDMFEKRESRSSVNKKTKNPEMAKETGSLQSSTTLSTPFSKEQGDHDWHR